MKASRVRGVGPLPEALWTGGVGPLPPQLARALWASATGFVRRASGLPAGAWHRASWQAPLCPAQPAVQGRPSPPLV